MIRLRTPSRLHFGLLAPAAHAGRRFGGVGLMVSDPGLELHLQPAAEWSFEGLLAERARAIVRHLQSQCPTFRPQRVRIERSVPEHRGLGTGTQLALALARGLAEANGWEARSAADLARLVGRGVRSALGIHGFEHGGFLVEGGKCVADAVAPLLVRQEFPADWRLVLIVPPWEAGLHSRAEIDAFERLALRDEPAAAARCGLVLLGLLPALVERDFRGFSEALHEFNRRAGEAFQEIQRGCYASDRIAELVGYIRALGVPGVGQSSWGPAVFALNADAERAAWLARQIQARYSFAPEEVVITSANNQGARLWQD